MLYHVQPGPRCRGHRECAGSDRYPHIQVHEVLHKPVPPQPELGRPPCSDSLLSKCYDRDVYEDGTFFIIIENLIYYGFLPYFLSPEYLGDGEVHVPDGPLHRVDGVSHLCAYYSRHHCRKVR